MDRIVLTPSRAAAVAHKKKQALNAGGSWATLVATPTDWLSDLWALYGSGERIVTPAQRDAALFSVLQRQASFAGEAGSRPALPVSLGMVGVLARLIESALGTPHFQDALDGVAALDRSDAPLVEAVREYETLLDERGLVDPGRACLLLAQSAALDGPMRVQCEGVHLLPAMEALLRSAPEVVLDPGAPCAVSRAPEGVGVRFAFSAGPSAVAGLLVDVAGECCRQGSVCITARDPLALFESTAQAFADKGIVCAVRGGRPFPQTDFGRAFLAAFNACTSDQLDACAVTDFLLNAFSGVSARAAYEFDARMRSDRLLGKEACLGQLRSLSRSFELFEELSSTPDASIVLDACADLVRAFGAGNEAYVAEQVAAIACMRDACEAARQFGVGMKACVEALGQAQVRASRQNGEGQPQAVIMSQRQAAQCAPGSFAAVVACDMSSAAYPLREPHDVVSAIEEKLRLPPYQQALRDAREVFSALVALPTNTLVIQRCLHDEADTDVYPCSVVEEFIDCYRADPSDPSDMHGKYLLPPCLQKGLAERGEELLYENAAASLCAQPQRARIEEPSEAQVTPAYANRIVLPRVSGASVVREPCYSASQIESYLECPQKWLATRRLRLDEVDEGFGPLEMGSFAHRALEVFYRRFQESVEPKVTFDTLGEARQVMRQVAAELAEAQFERRPSESRLVPTTELERRQVAELIDNLVGYLDREADLLPGFTPTYFEYALPVSAPARYAGRALVGSVDRVDVDAQGNAVIIDYKSSLSAEYDLYEPEKAGGGLRNGKVQALIYAQALRRVLGLNVVGAVYVGYGRAVKASGACGVLVEPGHVPGLRASVCAFRPSAELPTFDALLDAVEQRVEGALDRLEEGYVEARPSSAAVCAFCPKTSCAQRSR